MTNGGNATNPESHKTPCPENRVNITGITGAAVNDIVQAACLAAGLPGGYSGHSLRAGFVTAVAEAGLPEWAIMTQSRHRSPTTMAGYIRRGSRFRKNPAGGVGL